MRLKGWVALISEGAKGKGAVRLLNKSTAIQYAAEDFGPIRSIPAPSRRT